MAAAAADRVVSPPSGEIAYVHRTTVGGSADSDDEIWIMSTDGSRAHRICDHVGSVSDLRWSPDGQSLAVAAQDGDEAPKLWVMAADGSGRRSVSLLLPESGGAAGASRSMDGIAWSPDGHRIAVTYMVDVTGPDLWESWILVVDPGSGATTTLVGPDAGLAYHELAWAKNGSRIIASTSSVVRESSWLTSFDATTGRDLELMLGGGYFEFWGEPAFSPNGRWLACSVTNLEASISGVGKPWHRITLLSADGASQRVVAESTSDFLLSPSWSPGGRWLVASRGSHEQPRIVMLAAVKNGTEIDTAVPGSHPAWRPVAQSGDDTRDSDGDGLPDSWETKGVDTDGDEVVEVDLPAMGADPSRQDVFVEIDWMVEAPTKNLVGWKVGGHSHKPKSEALQKVMDAFKAHGIALHIDAGPGSVMDPYHPEKKWGEYSAAGTASAAGPMLEVKNLGTKTDKGYDFTDFSELRKRNFSGDRAGVFHYCLFAHRYGGDQSSGIAWFDEPILIVADGSGSSDNMNATEQAGTLMHELGHNFGLQDGGGDTVMYKPNYLSIMNYSFQMSGLLKNDQFGSIDYSSAKLDTLDESSLNEKDGIGPKGAVGSYGTVYWRDGRGGNLLNLAERCREDSLLGAINWNGDGKTENGIEEDLNTGPNVKLVLGEKLEGHDDWGNLHLDVGGGIGRLARTDAVRSARRDTSAELSPSGPNYEAFVSSGLVLRDYRVTVAADRGTVAVATPGAGSISLSLTVANEGLESDTYSLQAWGFRGIGLGEVPASLQLAAETTATVNVPIALPAGTPSGLVGSVRLLATSIANPEVCDEVEVAVYIESPRPTATLTLSGLISGAIKLGQVITISGRVTPIGVGGGRVLVRVQRKSGVTWTTVKTTSASSRPAGRYRLKYEPVAKGIYRMRAQVAQTATNVAATTPWQGFAVR